MDRIQLLYIDYTDWRDQEISTEGHSLEGNADNEKTVWPGSLYALDERNRCLTSACYEGRLRVVASEVTRASTLVNIAIGADHRESETDPIEWLFPDDLFDKSLLLDGEKCWCGCALVIGDSKNLCVRCNRTEAQTPKATKIVYGTETKSQLSANVGGKQIDLPAGYPFHWRVEDSTGAIRLILHYEGMKILARPDNDTDDTNAFIAVSWSRSGYGREYLEENPDLLLEDFAVKLCSVSHWRERMEIDELRCTACFRLRQDRTGPCCHCDHAPGEPPKRVNFLPKGEKIRIIYIGESDDLSMWFRELYDIDGNLYRLYHRGGNMYAFRVEDEFVLFERRQGGLYEGAGTNEEILQQTDDVFEVIDQGTECYICGALYPDDQVPKACYVCEACLGFENEIS